MGTANAESPDHVPCRSGSPQDVSVVVSVVVFGGAAGFWPALRPAVSAMTPARTIAAPVPPPTRVAMRPAFLLLRALAESSSFGTCRSCLVSLLEREHERHAHEVG